MESEEPPPLCPCSCLCCSAPSSSLRRSHKRKLEEAGANVAAGANANVAAGANANVAAGANANVAAGANANVAAGANANVAAGANATDAAVARVEIKNEAAALREVLCSQQQSIQELHTELDEERNASSTAASEAMSMILRLQREKAEAQMEFRQFKRFADSKMSHDQDEITALEELVFKKDEAIQSLSCEIQAYKHRLLSVVGYSPSSEPQTPAAIPTPSASAAAVAATFFDYPPLKCKVVPNADDDFLDNADDFGETPRDQIQSIEQRIARMERMPSNSHDKGVVGYSPRRPWQLRTMSMDSYGSFPLPVVDRGCDRDDTSDRVYTVDAVHAVPDDYVNTPREGNGGGGVDGEEIKRLYMRMQALEADRESMRQTIMSMGKDKAQFVLLKEIAQQMCKDVVPSAQQKMIVKKSPFSFIRCFSIVTAIKWVTTFAFRRKKSSRVKYTFGISNCNAGLLLLLEKSTWVRQRRCLTRTLR